MKIAKWKDSSPINNFIVHRQSEKTPHRLDGQIFELVVAVFVAVARMCGEIFTWNRWRRSHPMPLRHCTRTLVLCIANITCSYLFFIFTLLLLLSKMEMASIYAVAYCCMPLPPPPPSLLFLVLLFFETKSMCVCLWHWYHSHKHSITALSHTRGPLCAQWFAHIYDKYTHVNTDR